MLKFGVLIGINLVKEMFDLVYRGYKTVEIRKRFFEHPRLGLLGLLHRLSIDEYYYEVFMAENSPKILAANFVKADAFLRSTNLRNLRGLGPFFLSVGDKRRSFLGKLLMLYAVVRITGPKIVVETGVEHGFSSYTILNALRKNGQGGVLHSIDIKHETSVRGMATGHLVTEDLKGQWFIHIGDSRIELLRLLSNIGGFDLFYQDDAHRDYELQMLEYRASWEHLKPGGILFAAATAFNTTLRDFLASVDETLVTPNDLAPGIYPSIANWGFAQKIT